MGYQEGFASLRTRLDDDGKLYQKWMNKRVNAKKEGLSCDLTFDEYCQLVYEAGLVSSQLGFKGEGYVLARCDDKGDYYLGNCRFITQKENAKEKKFSERALQAVKENARIMNEHNRANPRIGELISRGIHNSESYKERVRIAEINRLKRYEAADPKRRGTNNSQYGTFWITNGRTNLKWKDDRGEMPDGFYRGRTVS